MTPPPRPRARACLHIARNIVDPNNIPFRCCCWRCSWILCRSTPPAAAPARWVNRLKQLPGDPFLRNANAAPDKIRKRDLFRRKIFGAENAWLPPPPPPPRRYGASDRTEGEKASAGKDDEGVGREGAVGGGEGSEVLSPGIVDTLFALLDVDSNGRLDQNEFMTLMKRQSAVPDPVRTKQTPFSLE